MELDRMLSRFTRALNRRVSMGRRLRWLREYYCQYYADRPDRWAIINDYRGGACLKLDRSAYMGSAIYWHGWHHGHELRYLERVLRPADVFVDVGANIGEFTIGLARCLPSGFVYAFEPQPDVRDLLEESVALNELSNVRVYPYGLAERTHSAALYASSGQNWFGGINEGLYSKYPDADRVQETGVAEFRPLDEVAREWGIKRIDWIKVDIEGGELFFLKGARATLASLQPNVILEMNASSFGAAGYSIEDVTTFMRDLNYQPWLLNTRGELTPYDSSQADADVHNVFFLPEVAKCTSSS